MTTTRVNRGPYAKGVRRREEILDRALEVYDEVGFRDVSLRAVGESIGVTHAALRHYFASIDDLLLAVLRRADDRALNNFDLTAFDPPDSTEVPARQPGHQPVDQATAPDTLGRAAEHRGVAGSGSSVVAEFSRRLAQASIEVPGLTALYATMAARAAETGGTDRTGGTGGTGGTDKRGSRVFFADRYRRVRSFARLVLEAGQRQHTVRDDIPIDTAAALLIAAADGLTTQWLIDPDVSIETGLRLLDQLLSPQVVA